MGAASAPQHIPGQTTEYTPAARPAAPGSTPAPALQNNPIAPTRDAGTAANLQPPPAAAQSNGQPVPGHQPQSSLPPVTAASTHPPIDPMNPTGIIPSTGNSVYDIDAAQFEGSGQPWRRPGSDITDWFNFGFDESTYPKFLRFRADMEAGKNALVREQNTLGKALC